MLSLVRLGKVVSLNQLAPAAQTEGTRDLKIPNAWALVERPLFQIAKWIFRPIPARRPAPKLPDGGPGFFAFRAYGAVVGDLRRSARPPLS